MIRRSGSPPLQLKSLIVQLGNFTQQKIKSLITHDLLFLWKHIKDNLQHLTHSQVNLNGINLLDQLLTELDSLDDNSFHFRYPGYEVSTNARTQVFEYGEPQVSNDGYRE